MTSRFSDHVDRSEHRGAIVPDGPVEGGRRDVPWFLDAREVLLTLRLRALWLAIPVAALLGLALLHLTLMHAQYTATTALLIDPQGLQVVKDDLNPPGQTNDASLLLVDSQMQVLSSDEVLRRVVDKLRLDRDPEFNGQSASLGRFLGLLSSLLGGGGPARDARLDALRSLRERLSVHRMERTFALSVGVTTDAPETSARIAQAVADTYLAYDQQVRVDLARRAETAISSRLGELQSDVRDAEDQAQAYRTAHNLVGTRTQLVSEQQLAQMSDQLGAARAKAAEQLTRLNQIQAVIKAKGSLTSLSEVLQSPTIGQLRTQLAQAERALAYQQTRLGSRHPALEAARNDVTAARAQLDAEVQRIVASVRDEYTAAAANAAQLSQALDNGKTQAVSVGDAMVHMRELERQIDARRSVYESFLVRAQQLQAQQQLGTSASRIISPATPPARRDGSPASVELLAALAAGLGLGVGCALVAERASGRVRTSRRLGQHLGVEVVGALPPAGDAGGHPEGAAGTTPVEARYDLAVTRLRNHLWRKVPEGGPRCFLVTAADALSGKSLLALRLATIAAADGERVLLVDADPDASLPAVFDLPITPLTPRLQDARTFLPERGVAQSPGLRYASVSRRAAKAEFRTVADSVFGRAKDFDAIIVNAGIVGADLFTERFVGDPRLSAVLLAVNADDSDFDTIDRALARVDVASGLAAVLTDASAIDT